VANGVTVAFGNPGQGAGGATTGRIAANSGNTMMELHATVTILSGLRGTELEAAAAHEGSHLSDLQAFTASFDLARPSWDLSLNLTSYQTELKAYRITNSVYAEAAKKFSMNCRGCTLGSGLRTPAEVDLAITKILTDPSGVYRVTSQNQGDRLLPDWSSAPPTP
jgi:hypothetical protein